MKTIHHWISIAYGVVAGVCGSLKADRPFVKVGFRETPGNSADAPSVFAPNSAQEQFVCGWVGRAGLRTTAKLIHLRRCSSNLRKKTSEPSHYRRIGPLVGHTSKAIFTSTPLKRIWMRFDSQWHLTRLHSPTSFPASCAPRKSFRSCHCRCVTSSASIRRVPGRASSARVKPSAVLRSVLRRAFARADQDDVGQTLTAFSVRG